jgi:hypothetical protein
MHVPVVQRVVQTSVPALRGEGFVHIYRVTYLVGEHGPFIADFQPADFTQQNVLDAMQKVADTVNALPSLDKAKRRIPD